MSDTAWTVDLTIGAHHWVIDRGDVPDPAAVNVLDGLSVTWDMPDTTTWPTQPNPTTLALTLLGPSAALQGIDQGTAVKCLIYAGVVTQDTGDPVPSVRFSGEISDLAAAVVDDYADDRSGLELQIVATDLTANLAAANVRGTFPFQGVTVVGWVFGMFDLAGVPRPDWDLGGDSCEISARLDGEVPGATLREAVDFLLSAYADGGPLTGSELDPANHYLYSTFGWQRGVVGINWTDAHDVNPVTPYRIDWVSRYNALAAINTPTNPGRFGPIAGGLFDVELVPPADPNPNTADEVVDLGLRVHADYVSRSATWQRTRRAGANQVIVTSDPETVTGWRRAVSTRRLRPGEPRLVGQIDGVRVVDQTRAGHVASMYTDGPRAGAAIWQAESLVWHASRDPQWPVRRVLFPDNWNTSLWRGHSAPVVVDGIPLEHNPDGVRWYVGTLAGATWTFTGGEFDIALKIAPGGPRGVGELGLFGATSITWRQLGATQIGGPPAPWDAATWAAMAPALTWADMILARPIASDYDDWLNP